MGAACHLDKAVGRDIHGVFEIGARGVQEAAREFSLVGECDGVHDKVDRGPAAGQRVEGRIERGVIGHVDIDHEIRSDAFGQRFEAAAEGVALVGKGKFRACFGQGLGDAPGDGAFIGDTHDQAAFSFEHLRHDRSLTLIFRQDH
jgi:hypothetical protein